MAERTFGVLTRAANSAGELVLILPDDSVAYVPADATEDELVTRYGLQSVVRPPKIDFCIGVCVDGPYAGKDCYAVDELGYQAGITTGGRSLVYEVIRVSDGAHPAVLRFVGYGKPKSPTR